MKAGIEEVARYRALAQVGNKKAQFKLAALIVKGNPHVIGQTKPEAYQLFLSSAAQDYPPAQYYLAEMLEHGDGVPQDHIQSLEWYQRVAATQDLKWASLVEKAKSKIPFIHKKISDAAEKKNEQNTSRSARADSLREFVDEIERRNQRLVDFFLKAQQPVTVHVNPVIHMPAPDVKGIRSKLEEQEQELGKFLGLVAPLQAEMQDFSASKKQLQEEVRALTAAQQKALSQLQEMKHRFSENSPQTQEDIAEIQAALSRTDEEINLLREQLESTLAKKSDGAPDEIAPDGHVNSSAVTSAGLFSQTAHTPVIRDNIKLELS